MIKAHTETLRLEKWKLGHSDEYEDLRGKIEHLFEVLSQLPSDDRIDATTLVSLVIEHLILPFYPSFPTVDVKKPTAEMSQSELEFHWEALGFTLLLLSQSTTQIPVRTLEQEYWQEMRKRVHGTMFGPPPAIEHSPDQSVDWTSINMVFTTEFLRGAKALYFLKRSDDSLVSSFTECHVWFDVLRTSTPTEHLLSFASSVNPEHLFYRELFYLRLRQRVEFIRTACERFLEKRQNFGSLPHPSLTHDLKEGIRRMDESLYGHALTFFRYKRRLLRRYSKMPEDFQGYLERVTSEIVNLKEDIAKKDYQWEDAVAKISKIVAATPRPLSFVPQDDGLPSEATPLFALLPSPENVCPQETSPYLAFAGRSRYVIELLQETLGFTSEQVNGAVTEIADMAEYALSVFDAYEKLAQWQTPLLSGEERQECRRLIVQGRNHLASTWQSIIDEHAKTYIKAVNRALAHIQ
ncbi:hypothetical protein SeMB42_g07999, partial [Synchytrium endobioticum]